MQLEARVDDLTSQQVQGLVFEHLRGMHANSPPGHVNAFAIEALQSQEVTFWSIWMGQDLVGCAALKELDTHSGEIKSMRTRPQYLRQGVGQYALDVITGVARRRGYRQLLLETGTGEAFDAAHRLYEKNGFQRCGPFGGYAATHFNIFMAKNLDD